MVSTNGFTTEAKVKARIANFNTAITSAQVDEFISHAESMVISTSKVKWTSKGSATIPALVETCTTDLAAIWLLASDPSGFSSLAESAFIADVLWASSRRTLNMLSDPIIVAKLKGDSKNG